MSALALLNEPCGPCDDDVREYMSGNICRCGAYANIVAAIQHVRGTAERERAMQTFDFLRAADAAAAIAARPSRRPPSRARASASSPAAPRCSTS